MDICEKGKFLTKKSQPGVIGQRWIIFILMSKGISNCSGNFVIIEVSTTAQKVVEQMIRDFFPNFDKNIKEGVYTYRRQLPRLIYLIIYDSELL